MSGQSEEQILRQETMHPAIFVFPGLAGLALLVVDLPVVLVFSRLRAFIEPGAISRALLLVVGLTTIVPTVLLFLWVALVYRSCRFTLTTRRLMYRVGFFTRRAGELPLENVEGLFLVEPWDGRLFGYGTVAVSTVGGAQLRLDFVRKPHLLHASIQNAVHAAKLAPGGAGCVSSVSSQGSLRAWAGCDQTRGTEPISGPSLQKPEFPLLAIAVLVGLVLTGAFLLLWRPVGSDEPVRAAAPPALPNPLQAMVADAEAAARTLAPQPAPAVSLEALTIAANQGDALAQDRLGDACRLNPEAAIVWYRKAAAQGVPNSQYQLAHILLSWAASPVAKPAAAAAHTDEAIPWLVKAANEGIKLAQVELGQLYAEGKFIQKDAPEAYKWFSLAADGGTMDFGANLGRTYRDQLVLKLSPAELAEANRRINGFNANPPADPPLPDPAYLADIRLNGISGTPPHLLAIINGKTFAAGESGTVKVGARTIVVHCLSVQAQMVRIASDGVSGERELHLR